MEARRRRLVFLVVIIMIIGVIATIFLVRKSPVPNTVTITNLGYCSPDMNTIAQDKLYSQLYNLVKDTNNFNRHSTQATYNATFRKDTCNTTSNTARTSTDDLKTVFSTTATVDIPLAKQSWQIQYGWVKGGGSVGVDLGTMTPTCLNNSQLLYGDFQCTKALNYITYGTADYDPIMKYTPYTGVAFDLTYGPNTRTVIATILVEPKDADNSVLIANEKIAIGVWFQEHNLDITKYTIHYIVSPTAE